jgi:hypothetical protein
MSPIEVDTERIAVSKEDFKAKRRQMLAKAFENCKGSIEERMASLSVDEGQRKTLAFYLGAENLAQKALAQFTELKRTKEIREWSIILGYISYQLIVLAEIGKRQKLNNTPTDPTYIS